MSAVARSLLSLMAGGIFHISAASAANVEYKQLFFCEVKDVSLTVISGGRMQDASSVKPPKIGDKFALEFSLLFDENFEKGRVLIQGDYPKAKDYLDKIFVMSGIRKRSQKDKEMWREGYLIESGSLSHVRLIFRDAGSPNSGILMLEKYDTDKWIGYHTVPGLGSVKTTVLDCNLESEKLRDALRVYLDFKGF